MTEARILHARSGVVLEHRDDGYRLTSLRLEAARDFNDLATAEQAFDAEVLASENDPEIVSRLGGA
ncbi:MAG: hypothetical protein DI531_03050 [Brevundimonas sp.]|uniref:hypothetical protein n=1 Tax=Brevundimonas sp. TaxID=1871086 RepID=UPI000DB21C0B|nr:hypothetical protein [Brevundimonas sp.]PZU76266.1 MAG: hypothetical protein DI531_03050 [Brevundimonas sp.]